MSLFPLFGHKRDAYLTVRVADDDYRLRLGDGDGLELIASENPSIKRVGDHLDYFAGRRSKLRLRPFGFEVTGERPSVSGTAKKFIVSHEPVQRSEGPVTAFEYKPMAEPGHGDVHIGTIEGASQALSGLDRADIYKALGSLARHTE